MKELWSKWSNPNSVNFAHASETAKPKAEVIDAATEPLIVPPTAVPTPGKNFRIWLTKYFPAIGKDEAIAVWIIADTLSTARSKLYI